MKTFLTLLLLLTGALQAHAQAQKPEVGFQFVLVVSHQSQDVVYSNADISNRDFDFGEMKCTSRLESKKDPVYPEQTLGSLILDCRHNGFPVQTSVTCSKLDSAAQTHFEFGPEEQKFSFDLLCKAKAL